MREEMREIKHVTTLQRPTVYDAVCPINCRKFSTVGEVGVIYQYDAYVYKRVFGGNRLTEPWCSLGDFQISVSTRQRMHGKAHFAKTPHCLIRNGLRRSTAC